MRRHLEPTSPSQGNSGISSPSSKGRRKPSPTIPLLIVVLGALGYVYISSIFPHDRDVSSKADARYEHATPYVLETQRLGYLFTQMAGYHAYAKNDYANAVHTLDWGGIGDMFTMFADLHEKLEIAPECDVSVRHLGVSATRVRGITPPKNWYTINFLDESIQAFSCGFQRRQLERNRITADLLLHQREDWMEKLWRLMSPYVPLHQDTSQYVPFLSWRLSNRVNTKDYTAAALLRLPTAYTMGARLWVQLFSGAVTKMDKLDNKEREAKDEGAINVNLTKLEELHDAELTQITQSFKQFFTKYCATFVFAVCENAFVKSIPEDVDEFFALDETELFTKLMGYSRSDESSKEDGLKEATCAAQWAGNPRPPQKLQQYIIDVIPRENHLIGPKTTPGKHTIVFDMDETLAFTRVPPLALRPHLEEMLKSLVALQVEIVVWSAATPAFGDPILTEIGSKYFHYKIWRDVRWYKETKQGYTKDLRLLGRDMDYVVIIENSPSSVWMNKDNAILIPDYTKENKNDKVLETLEKVLRQLLESDSPVPPFVQAAAELRAKCPRWSYNPHDYNQPYYGIGPFTS